MVFNNDCQYYSTLQNSIDMLSFSNPNKTSIQYNTIFLVTLFRYKGEEKKKTMRIRETIENEFIIIKSNTLITVLVHIFQKISTPVPQIQPFSHYSTCSNRCQVSELRF